MCSSDLDLGLFCCCVVTNKLSASPGTRVKQNNICIHVIRSQRISRGLNHNNVTEDYITLIVDFCVVCKALYKVVEIAVQTCRAEDFILAG